MPEPRRCQGEDARAAAEVERRTGRARPSRSSRQSSVVACPPVPKARPGSITTAGSPAGGVSQGGPTHSLPATVRPVWNARQPSSQPSATGSSLHVPGDLGQLRWAIRAVDGELEPAAGAAPLLDAVGERLEHCRARDLLGLVAGRAREHEPDHPKARRNRSRRPPRERSGCA